MNRAEFVFKAIDVLGYKLQNAVTFPGITSVRDIKYSDKGGGKLTSGDLYFKSELIKSEKKHPVILYIHGGGYIMGDKSYRVSVSEYYANEGYFVFNINHRLPPEAAFPENIRDCVDALNFLTELAEKYPIDLDNIVLTGDSSGAYMCSYIAALKFDGDLRKKIGMPEINVDIKALMLMCGIYDVEVLVKGKTLFGVIPETARMLTGFGFKNDFSNLKDYELINEISSSNFVNGNWCPAFICWADDDIICQGQGEPMAEKLKKAGVVCDTYHCKGLIHNHCYHLMFVTDKYSKICMGASADFLKKICK